VKVIRAVAATGLLAIFSIPAFSQAPAQNYSRSFGPDACGPADPAYIHTANETGGIPMFLQRSEAAKSFQLVRESARSNVSTVFWGSGSLGGKTETIEIPVDSVTQRVTFVFSTDTKGGKLIVKQPSGGALENSTASTEITDLNCGRILTVSTPEAGNWRVEISGTGRYWLEAEAQSDIHIIKAEFVKVGGRLGHEGFFRIQGQPVIGKPATLQVSLSAKETRTTEFELVNERGESFQGLKLHATNTDREFLDFTGEVELPAVPFRIAVKGRDSQGRAYQRLLPSLFHAESAELTPTLNFDELLAGETRRATFTLRNIGAARTFKLTVTDARRFVTGVEPMELSLGPDESGNVSVDVSVPAGTSAGSGDDLIIVAASKAGPPTSNSSVVHLSVASEKASNN
jgi:hypothetical protein